MTDDVELTTTRLKLDLLTRRMTKFTEEESSVFIVIGKQRRTMSLYLNKGRYGDGGKWSTDEGIVSIEIKVSVVGVVVVLILPLTVPVPPFPNKHTKN